MTKTVVVLPANSRISPYSLQQSPIDFKALVWVARNEPKELGGTSSPVVTELHDEQLESFVPIYGTRAYVADERGLTMLWKSNI